MALITCPECRKEVSELAESCPGCGSPIDSEAKTKKREVAGYRQLSGLLFFGALAFLVIVAWSGGVDAFAKEWRWARWVMGSAAVYYIACEIARNLSGRRQ